MQRLTVCFLVVILTPWANSAAPETPGNAKPPGTAVKSNVQLAKEFFMRAQQAYLKNQYMEAAELFEKANKTWSHPAMPWNIATCYRKAKKYDKAANGYRQFIKVWKKKDDDYANAHLYLGDCLLLRGKVKDARTAYGAFAKLKPKSSLVRHIEQCLKTGKPLSEMDKRDAEQVKQARALHERARKLYEEAKCAEAATLYMQGWQKFKMPEMLSNAGECYLLLLTWNKAAEVLEQRLALPAPEQKAYRYLAWSYHHLGNFAKARATYERYLKAYPNGSHAAEAHEYVKLHTQPGAAQRTQQQWKASRDAIAQAEKDYKLGRYQQALVEFQRAEKAVPLRATAFNIGLCFEQLQQYDAALRRYDALLRERDMAEDGLIRLRAAECCLKEHDPAEAAKHIEAFQSKYNPALPNAPANLAWANQLMAKIKKAKQRGSSRHGPATPTWPVRACLDPIEQGVHR